MGGVMAKQLRRFGSILAASVIPVSVLIILILEPLAEAKKAIQLSSEIEFRTDLYQSVMVRKVVDEQGLNDEMLLDYRNYAVLMVPGEDFTVAFDGGVLPYDAFSFPKVILSELTRTELNGIPSYSIIMWIDPVTWETVIFDAVDGKEVYRIQPDRYFNPLDLITDVWGETTLLGASDTELLTSYSPSRMWLQYDLIESKDVPPLILKWSVPRNEIKQPGSPQITRGSSRSMRSSSSDFKITAMAKTTSGMELTIQLPTGWASTNDIDVFGTDNLSTYWWELLTTTNGSNTITWTDTESADDSIATRYYNVGDGETDTDSDGYTDAREELMYHSDPDDENSFPVTVSGSVTHPDTSSAGPVYILAVTGSNSWDLGRSTKLTSTGAYSIAGIPNQDDYFIKAWRDWHQNGSPDEWEATGTATNYPIYLTNSVSNIVITLIDPPAGVAGTISYTGLQSGVCRAVAVASSGSWSTNYCDVLATPGAYFIDSLSQTDYYVKAWIDADSDGLFDTNNEASGTWPSNPISLSNSVWQIDFDLTDVNGDGDSMPDWWEIHHFGNTNQSDSGDYDGDTMPNGWEYTWSFCPTNPADAMEDIDGDGYFNVYEYHHDSNPWNSDATPGMGGGGGSGEPEPTVTVVTNGGTTIQAALAQSTNDYDIVLVEAGTYLITNDIDFSSNVVLLISADGPSDTVIDADGTTRVIEFEDPVTSHASIRGFTITGGSKGKGAGIRLKENANPTIVSCIISNNNATEDGGGVWCENASPEFRNCTFVDNQAEDDGGGVFCKDGGTPRFSSCYFTVNLAKDNGGGLCFKDSSTGTVSSCTIAGNTAYDHGGGIYCKQASPSIESCLVSDNTAIDGGGIGCNSSQVSVVGCQIIDNWAHVDGGGFRAKDSQPILRSTIIARNRAFGHGGGVQAKGFPTVFSIENCTIADNQSSLSGGGLSATDSASVTNKNTILWGNSPQQLSGTVDSRYSCVQEGTSGTGIVTGNPSLTPVSYSLQVGSSCTNAGTNAIWMASASDIDGESRVGDSIVDIGADELYDSDDDGMSDAWESSFFGGLGMDGAADSDGDGLSDADEFAWDTDPTDSDTDDDGGGDALEVTGGTSPTEPDDEDTLNLMFRIGDPSNSGSETYKISFSNDYEIVTEANTSTGMVQSFEHDFLKGTTYTIRVEHLATDGSSDCGSDPDYDYRAWIEDTPDSTNGSHDAWIYGSGYMIHDPNRILGTHDTEDCTSSFAATSGTGYATLYVLEADVDVDINQDGTFSETEDVLEGGSNIVFLCVNNDDDDGNWTNDCEDVLTSLATNEDDLVQFPVNLGPDALDFGSVVLEIVEGTNNISIWNNPYKGASSNCLVGVDASANSITWNVGPSGDITNLGAFAYSNFWIEGITNTLTNTRVVVELRCKDTNDVVRCADTNVFRVLEVLFVHAEGSDEGDAMTHLPVHTPCPNGGIGMGAPTGSTVVADLTMEFSGATTPSVADTIDVAYLGTNCTVTETSVNSLVFEDGSSTLSLSLLSGFLNSTSEMDEIELTATFSALGITNATYTCFETATNSMTLDNYPCGIRLELSGLNSTTADTNTMQISGVYASYSNSLTETAANSYTFSESNITVNLLDNPTLSATNADMLIVAIDYASNDMSNTVLRAWETGTNTLIFTNCTPGIATDLSAEDIAVPSNVTWQVKINGLSDPTLIASAELTTDDDTNSVTLATVASLLSTEKFVLSPLGITPADVGGGYSVLNLDDIGAVWTKNVQHVQIGLAFISGCRMSRPKKAKGSAVVLESIDLVGIQLFTRKRITWSLTGQGLGKGLGYSVLADYNRVKKVTALSDKYIKGKSLWYSMSHGNVPGGPTEEFKGLEFVDGVIKKNSLPAGLDYELVMANACCSAQTDNASKATAKDNDTVAPNCAEFADKWGANAAYVGWAWKVQPNWATQRMEGFIEALEHDSSLGRGRTVQEARDKVVADADGDAMKLMKTYGSTNNIIDRRKN